MRNRIPLDFSSAVVTGGAGFIGSHLVEELVANNVNVTVVDNLVNGSEGNLASVRDRIHLCMDSVISCLKKKSLSLEEYDCVFHLAANAYVPPSTISIPPSGSGTW